MNPSPWQVLGLEPGADARAVKRAYARLLKEVRPETDPARFQLVRWAYEAALSAQAAPAPAAEAVAAVVEEPERADVDSAEGPSESMFAVAFEPIVAPVIEPTLSPPRKPMRVDPLPRHAVPIEIVDVDALADLRSADAVAALLHEAVFQGADALAAAIDDAPELFSLVERPRIEDLVLRRLLRDERLPTYEAFDHLANYFHWFEIGGRSQRLREREGAAFDQYTRRIAARDEIARTTRIDGTQQAFRMRLLVDGWRWWSWLLLMVPGEWLQIAQMLWRFRSRFGSVAGEFFDARAVRRIERVAERRKLHWEQLVISLGRVVLLSVVFVPLLSSMGGNFVLPTLLRTSGGALLALLAVNLLRVAFHHLGEMWSRLHSWYEQYVVAVRQSRPWVPPIVRLLVPGVIPFVAWLHGPDLWVLYNLAGMIALLLTSSGAGLALVDFCGVFLWAGVFGTAKHVDMPDLGPWIGLSIVLIAVARELSRIGAEGPEPEHLLLRRAAVQLAAPFFLMWLILER